MNGSYLLALWLTGLVMTSPARTDRDIALRLDPGQPVETLTDTTTTPIITHGPYLQLPSASSMTIVWHTDQICVSRVEYGLGDLFDRVAISSRQGLIDNDRTNHVIRLTGLEPGTTYRYRVVSRAFLGYERQHIVAWGDSVISAPFEFTTLDPARERYSFSMVSDLHERSDELTTMIGSEAWQEIDFAIYNGDMIDDFMRYDQIFTGFLDASVDGYATEIPFIFTRGTTRPGAGLRGASQTSSPLRTDRRITPSTMDRSTSSCSIQARIKKMDMSTTMAWWTSPAISRNRRDG